MSLIFGVIKNYKEGGAEADLMKMHQGLKSAHLPLYQFKASDESALGILSKKEEKAYQFGNNRYTIFSASRLDYRDELGRKLGWTENETLQASDHELIAGAYLRWKEESVSQLYGDWAFAVWDESEKKVFLARDQVGNTAMYYYVGSDGFVFCSSVQGIRAVLHKKPAINQSEIIRLLLSVPQNPDETFFQNVFRLSQAECLTYSNGILKKRNYLDFSDLKVLNGKEDFASGLLDRLKQAVQTRIVSAEKAGMLMSGGLDSSSVGVLAANILKEKGYRLSAFTSVPGFPLLKDIPVGRYADETDFVKKVAVFNGNIEAFFVKSEGASLHDSLKEAIRIHGGPVHAAGNQFWIQDILRRAEKEGIDAMFTGQGGNVTVSWPIRKLAAQKPSGFRSLIRTLIKSENKAKAKTISKNERMNWFNPEFLTSSLAGIKTDEAENSALSTFERRKKLLFQVNAKTGAHWHDLGNYYNMTVLDPTMDLKLVEFCLAIPDTAFSSREYSRPVLRDAMKGLLPEEIRMNSKRGYQASDLSHRLYVEKDDFADRIQSMRNHPAVEQYINLSSLFDEFGAFSAESGKLKSLDLLRFYQAALFIQTEF